MARYGKVVYRDPGAESALLASTPGGGCRISPGWVSVGSARFGGNRPATVQQDVAARNEQSGSVACAVGEDRAAAAHP
jgi:hypothetical protein